MRKHKKLLKSSTSLNGPGSNGGSCRILVIFIYRLACLFRSSLCIVSAAKLEK